MQFRTLSAEREDSNPGAQHNRLFQDKAAINRSAKFQCRNMVRKTGCLEGHLRDGINS